MDTNNHSPVKKILLIAVSIILIGIGVYAYIALKNSYWPFTSTSQNSIQQPLKIVGLKIGESVDPNDESVTRNNVLEIDVARDADIDGYCVLTLKNQKKNVSIVLDESKPQNDGNSPKTSCVTWSVDVESLPKGTYTAEVNLVNPSAPQQDTRSFELK